MPISESEYLAHIQHIFPELDLTAAQINRDGMVNVSVIVNAERVFRFPREDWGVALLRNERKVLQLVGAHVDLPIPDWDYVTDEMVSYPYITGDPLLTDDILRMSETQQDALAETLAIFLKQIHSIPKAEIQAAQIGISDTARSRDDWLQLYEEVQEHLCPLMWADGREWVTRHFEPLLTDSTFMDHEPIFMNGDLATYHLILNRETSTLNGIIDFGTAGMGDPAADFATIINQYGESFLRRMSRTYPEIETHIARSRFWAGTLELQWALGGLKNKDNGMFVVHIGRARDMMPIESEWYSKL